jgi:hypothetical protein
MLLKVVANFLEARNRQRAQKHPARFHRNGVVGGPLTMHAAQEGRPPGPGPGSHRSRDPNFAKDHPPGSPSSTTPSRTPPGPHSRLHRWLSPTGVSTASSTWRHRGRVAVVPRHDEAPALTPCHDDASAQRRSRRQASISAVTPY